MKKLALAAVLLAAAAPAAAFHALPSPSFLFRGTNASPWAVAIEGGYSHGDIKEYVYVGAHTLSRLDWDLHALVTVGARGTWEFSAGSTLGAGVRVGLKGRQGLMDDYDWRFPDGSGGYQAALSDWSQTDNDLLRYFAADLNLLHELAAGPGWRLHLLAGLACRFLKFDGNGGYNLLNFGTTAHAPFSGSVITYAVEQLSGYVGGQYGVALSRRLHAALAVLGAPLTFTRARDDHLPAGVAASYLDLPRFGWYGALRLAASYVVAAEFTIGVVATASAVAPHAGASYTSPLGMDSWTLLGNTGGSSSTSFGVDIFIEWDL